MAPTATSIPPHVLRTLGKAVRAARKKAGLTQEDLARQVGVWRGTIANIERGSQNTTVALLWHICHITGVSVESLFGEHSTPTPS
jgi:transcriptional regulator with XRE-family HTH domain